MSVGRMNRRAFGAAWSLNYALVSLVIIASWPAPVEARDIYTTLTDNAGESCHSVIAGPRTTAELRPVWRC